MLIVDDQRRYVTANAPALGLLGMAPEEVPWHRIDDFTPAQDRARLVEQWDAFLVNGGMEGLFHLRLPTGAWCRSSSAPPPTCCPDATCRSSCPRAEDFVEASQGVVHREAGWTRLVAREAEQAPLTAREHEVITLVSAGLQGGEIATRLGVSPETIKSHVQNAMTKLGAHTRAHAVAIALSTGQIDLYEEPGTGSSRS